MMTRLSRLRDIWLVGCVAVLVTPLNFISPASGQVTKDVDIREVLSNDTVAVGWLTLSSVDFRHPLAELMFPDPISVSDEPFKQLLDPLNQLDVDQIYWIKHSADLSSLDIYVVIPSRDVRVNELVAETGGLPVMQLEGATVAFYGNATSPRRQFEGELPEAAQRALDEMDSTDGANGWMLTLPAETRTMLELVVAKLWPDFNERFPNLLGNLFQFQSVRLGISDSLDQLSVRMVFPDEATVQAVAADLSLMFRSDVYDHLPWLADLPFDIDASTLVLDLDRETLEPILETIDSIQNRLLRLNNLRQVVLGLHNFHDIHHSLPPQAIVNEEGEKLLSWRVAILPLLEVQSLFEQFRLDEPWDSEHNLELVSRIPQVFQPDDPELVRQGKTRIVAPMTADSIFGRPGDPMTLQQVTDGTVNTIILVETKPSQAVVWTQPVDLEVDLEAIWQALAGAESDSLIAATADGAVHRLPKLDEETLRILLAVDSGKLIDWSEIEAPDPQD